MWPCIQYTDQACTSVFTYCLVETKRHLQPVDALTGLKIHCTGKCVCCWGFLGGAYYAALVYEGLLCGVEGRKMGGEGASLQC